MLNKKNAIKKMNYLGKKRIPFLFIIDYKINEIYVLEKNEIRKENVYFKIGNIGNIDDLLIEAFEKRRINNFKKKGIQIDRCPFPYLKYQKAFEYIKEEMRNGNTYLANLTFPSAISTNASLKEIFLSSYAKAKLLFKNRFTVFSPELFIKIRNNKIYSYPMKGTIDASIPEAEKNILHNHKEYAEQTTITDLIRNDLAIVSRNIRVTKFRYIEKIRAGSKSLLQVSSEIVGDLPNNYEEKIGDIIIKLLPAGSICGAPKKRTLEIIDIAEKYKRGFYTGVFGYFNGSILDSAVMIRFIEKNNGKLFYKSGGGITIHSEPLKEYEELINKIYVPIHRNNKD